MDASILIIEDEAELAELIRLHIGDVGNDVHTCLDGAEGLELACSRAWDLIILDLALPGIDGLEICRQLRRNGRNTPILMVTSRTGEMDRVLGLETGADDYLTKPFSVLELTARVRAIVRRVRALRRENGAVTRNVIRAGDVRIDVDQRRVTIDGREVVLTAREFDLLRHFSTNPGTVYTRAQLLDSIWGYGHDGYEHTVNSHINRLRAKIERDPSHPERIVTVWGVGYKLARETPTEAAAV